MNGLNEIHDSALRESTFIYFSKIATLKRNDITKMETFEDILISILWITADDGDVPVKIPDDRFGKKKKKRKCVFII